MTIKKSNVSSAIDAEEFLEKRIGGPLTLGKALRGYRFAMALSQAGFAKKLGISKANLSDIENERRFVSADKAADFARRLDHPPVTFVTLAIEDQLRRAGLKFRVVLKAA